MTLEDGLQKRFLRDNPFVQAPVWDEVKEALSEIKISDSYYSRGDKKATIDLERVLEKHRKWVSGIVDLSDFKYGYVTSGVTEALNHWRMTDQRPWCFFEGDYQWPNIVSKNGVEVKETRNETDVLYVSNPSCSTGNFIDIKDIKNPVILDCAYVGSTRVQRIGVPENTEQIMFGFSKGFGLVGQRCGIVYTKKPHPTFHPMKQVECWDYTTPLIIESIIERFSVDEMFEKYSETQKTLCEENHLIPSDSYFIATSEDPYYRIRRRKGETARLCMTSLSEKTNEKE